MLQEDVVSPLSDSVLHGQPYGDVVQTEKMTLLYRKSLHVYGPRTDASHCTEFIVLC